jgi:hypothetical protein
LRQTGVLGYGSHAQQSNSQTSYGAEQLAYFKHNHGSSHQQNFDGSRRNTQINLGVDGSQTNYGLNSFGNRQYNVIDCKPGQFYQRIELKSRNQGNVLRTICDNGVYRQVSNDQSIDKLFRKTPEEEVRDVYKIYNSKFDPYNSPVSLFNK